MLVSLTIFLPFAAFIIVIILGKIVNFKYSQYITSSFVILSSFLSWIIFFKILSNSNTYKVHLFNWINSGEFFVDWSLRVDTLTAVMLIVVTNISSAVHIYSIGYMKGDNSIPRFMAYLSLFTFFMLSLVTSDNLLQMFFGWEGVGLASYLLIGFWHHKKKCKRCCYKGIYIKSNWSFCVIAIEAAKIAVEAPINVTKALAISALAYKGLILQTIKTPAVTIVAA